MLQKMIAQSIFIFLVPCNSQLIMLPEYYRINWSNRNAVMAIFIIIA